MAESVTNRKRHTNVLRALLAAAVLGVLLFIVIARKDDVLKFDRKSPVVQWQSYSASPPGVHEWVDGDFKYTIEKMAPISDQFHSGYSFVSGGKIHFHDLVAGKSYRMDGDRFLREPAADDLKRKFKSQSHDFEFDSSSHTLNVCFLSESRSCDRVTVKQGTYPYLYASADKSDLVITNIGEALLFKRGAWCRMKMANDIYYCEDPQPEVLATPRGVQFYSSVLYQGKTLVGEWPTGRIYEFDGEKLAPSNLTPPDISAAAPKRLGYEAQSMAGYCGDLFVGYWPKGEIYRYDSRKKAWSVFSRLFTPSPDEAFIPFFDRPKDNLDKAFFGQRVTALIPFEGSLYATTSNLREWTPDIVPKFMPLDKVQEYGAIYRITRAGCRTSYEMLP